MPVGPLTELEGGCDWSGMLLELFDRGGVMDAEGGGAAIAIEVVTRGGGAPLDGI